jgi:RNA polymerase sigma-70 factor (ECF subfamily)
LNDPQASQEVVQDIFLKLWETHATFHSDGSGKSFLFQAVHNKSLNILAHKKVVNRYSEMIKAVYAQPEEFDVQESLMAKELNSQIQAIIISLAPECKKIFLMSRAEGKKLHEIADELHISVKTVETQINRALKKLRAELSDYMIILAIILFLNS